MSVLLGGGLRLAAGSRAVRPAGTFLGWTVVWGGRRARRPRTPPEATNAECISGPKTGQTSNRASAASCRVSRRRAAAARCVSRRVTRPTLRALVARPVERGPESGGFGRPRERRTDAPSGPCPPVSRTSGPPTSCRRAGCGSAHAHVNEEPPIPCRVGGSTSPGATCRSPRRRPSRAPFRHPRRSPPRPRRRRRTGCRSLRPRRRSPRHRSGRD